MTTLIPPDYAAWLAELKTTIRTARLKAGLAVNRELVLLYWRIGQEILERQSAQGWGGEGHRPTGPRPPCRVLRHERFFPHQSALHAGVCFIVARGSNCPPAWWTNSMAAQLRDHRPSQRSADRRVVHPQDHQKRLEPVGARTPDRDGRSPARGCRANQLRSCAAVATVRPGTRYPQDPYTQPVRLCGRLRSPVS